MTQAILKPLFRHVTAIAGVGEKMAAVLERINCTKIIDLLYYLPSGLIAKKYMPSLGELSAGGQIITEVTLTNIDPKPTNYYKASKRKPFKISGSTIFGNLNLVYFNYYPEYLLPKLKIGEKYAISGKLEYYNGQPTVAHPDHFVAASQILAIPKTEIIYPLTYALHPNQLQNLIHKALAYFPDNLP